MNLPIVWILLHTFYPGDGSMVMEETAAFETLTLCQSAGEDLLTADRLWFSEEGKPSRFTCYPQLEVLSKRFL